MRSLLVVAVVLVGAVQAQMLLRSPDFENFQSIPPQYCCDKVWRDFYRPSPPLEWFRAPAKAQSFVLLMDDMDADGFVHWLVKDIPKDATHLPADASEVNMPEGSHELLNSYGYDSYGGPCPSGNAHNYRFRLFAMPTAHTAIDRIEDPESLRSSAIVSQLQDDALYVAVLVGKFYLPNYSPPRNTTRGLNGTAPSEEIPNPRRERLTELHNPQFNSTNHTRHFMPGQEIPMRRFVKPSEALKSERNPQATASVDCASPEGKLTAQCIVAAAKSRVNTTGNATEQMHSTQWLVSQRVEAFKKEVDEWSCQEELKRSAGVRVVSGQTERCTLQTRVTDAVCERPFFPRQFVCPPPGMHNASLGVSPSLEWLLPPPGTESFVVLMEESSAPPFVENYGKVFWLVTDIPASVARIESGASGNEMAMPPLSIEHKNSFNHTGYTAPCPGAHDAREYRLRVFAMPHQKTKVFMSWDMHSAALVQQLQSQALCMSVVELPFSFRSSFVTPSRVAERSEVVDTAGELVVDV